MKKKKERSVYIAASAWPSGAAHTSDYAERTMEVKVDRALIRGV